MTDLVDEPDEEALSETAEVRIVTAAILFVSRERVQDDPTTAFLASRVHSLGHQVIKRLTLGPSRESIEQQLRAWIAEESIDVILVAGGVGLLPEDVVPEAVRAVVEREMPGFGEAVRAARSEHVGLAAIQGREVAGVSVGTFVLAISGELEACTHAWDAVIEPLLDVTSDASLVPFLDRLTQG